MSMTTTTPTTTIRSAATPQNPTNLPSRYEIRRLDLSHLEWVKAIMSHSTIFCSPVWPLLYPEKQATRAYAYMAASAFLARHQIESGMSFGVFDVEYQYKRPESAATDGALYWDEHAHPDATRGELLAQMDFPLVSIALAYDQFNPFDMAQLEPLMHVVPHFAIFNQAFEALDHRPKTSWAATGPKQVLLRNATSTREDYDGQHLMGSLARFLMREAKMEGYRAIQIEGAHDAVSHVWLNPPAPFKATLVAEVDMATWEVEEGEGEHKKKVKAFAPATQVCTRIFVLL